MQTSYDTLLSDYSPFLFSEPDTKGIQGDPWCDFSIELEDRLPDTFTSGVASALPYGSSSGEESDFYGYTSLDDFTGSPMSDPSSSSSPRSSSDDPTLSPSSSITDDRDETFATTDAFSAPLTSLFAYEDEVYSSPVPQQCPSPLANVSELSNLPASRASSRSSSPISASGRVSPSYDSDADADGENESGSEFEVEDSGDDDYVDEDDEDYSPSRSSRKKTARTTRTRAAAAPSLSSVSRTTRSTRAQRYSPYSSPCTSPSSPSSECDALSSRGPQLKHTSARKVQLSALVQKAEPVTKGSKRWNCMHCDYVQKNHRRPDLNRHIAGHFQQNKFVCCGVPLHLASHYGVPASAERHEWLGEEMIGGCWQVFSRQDALIRHLKNPRKRCVHHRLLPSKVLKRRK